MKKILGEALTVRKLLEGAKYSVDYYQREYKWQEKQILELIADLSGKFLEEHDEKHPRSKVADYPHYFLGSIITSEKDGSKYIVDGQQRLTSLTLLLIFLHNLQKDRQDKVAVDKLIFSEKYGEKSYNLSVPERVQVMEALFNDQAFDPTDRSESIRNIVVRYKDIESSLPADVIDDSLPYFIDWLLENVHLVEITAFSDDDAYTIFETMNDRGLSLSPTDMLKGYLLANIEDTGKRTLASTHWRDRVRELNETGKEVEPDFFKAWFRSQYATRIRERKKNAKPEDFDRIGTEFHRWLRDASASIGLSQSDDFYTFIDRNFAIFSRHYLRLMKASKERVPQLEHVLYNAHHGFTLQYMLLLAPLTPDDPEPVALCKQRLVARYIDILLARRVWNFRSIAYSTMQYAMFLVMRDIRGLPPDALALHLTDALTKEHETFTSNDRLRLHQQNRYQLHRLLARMTEYVEVQSGQPSHYLEYVNEAENGRYEVEHIWANHAEQHLDEFASSGDFDEYRNRIGGLLLLPRKFNGSYGDLRYERKLPHYLSQNVLARSLHPQCYNHNPGFLAFIQRSGLRFQPHEQFRKADLDARGELYRDIAMQVWNPEQLLGQACL